jgi:2-oxo-4-hydroxy-4-carboxy--5-ureidoimidazoline (OHCU) decarboxylase
MNRTMITLDELNALDDAGFVRALDGVFEHAPWVAAGAVHSRPFAAVTGLHAALMLVVRRKPPARADCLPQRPSHSRRQGRQGRRRDG